MNPFGGVRRPRQEFVESYRFLAASVRAAELKQALRSVLVMSAYPGDGRTTTAMNLAMALAEEKDSVLLVEGDVRRPKLASLLQAEGAPSLQELLAQKQEQEGYSAIKGNTTSVAGVRLLPAAPLQKSDPLPPLRLLMARLPTSQDARFVVFDSPACDLYADAFQLAPLVDGVIYMIKRRRQDKALHQKIRAQLDAVGANLLGVVFNEG